ncbi:MAG TPA: TIGR01777 family oxidoreductase [Bacteroidales bacterium]|nr:TIGR01777 family oxidoreductase [Bacteroidales bacterium]
MEKGSVLITGGTGLVGRNLTALLLSEGHSVSHLSRKPVNQGAVKSYFWDPGNGIIDTEAFNNVSAIIHLAGAGIANSRWTTGRRSEIVGSRVESAGLIFKTVSSLEKRPGVFISSSATGIYGSFTSGHIFTETDLPSSDFLGRTCMLWEEAAGMFSNIGMRTVIIRTGIVLARNEGALKKFTSPAGFGFFPVLGNGRQYLPWIHITDLAGIYLRAINDLSMKGPYNAVSPEHVTQKEFMRIMARVMKKPFIHPPVPAFLLKAAMGESSVIALEGSRVSASRITDEGFIFRFAGLEQALADLLY